MTDQTDATAPATAEPLAAPDTVEVTIGGKTETFTAGAADRSAAEKIALAEGVWTAWRNKHFVGLPTDVFNRLNGAGADLVSAIAALL